MTIKYSLNARERVKKAEYKNFIELTQGIDKSKLEEIVRPLPRVKGFRSGKDTEIRLKLYFGRSSSWDEKDWSLLQNIWLAYTEDHTAFKTILDLNNNETLVNIVHELLSSSEKRQEIIEKIISSIHTENITQKSLKNWLLFSPLPQDDAVEKLLAFVPKESPVELKGKISSLESQINLIKKETVQVNQLQATNKILTKINSELIENSKEFNTTKKELEQAVSKINVLEKVKKEVMKDLEGQSESLQLLFSSYREISYETKNLRNELNLIKKSINEIDSKQETQQITLDQINTVYQEMINNIQVLMQDIEEMKNMNISHTLNPSKPSKKHISTEVKVNIRNHPEDAEVLKLHSINEAVAHLEKNLNLLGIKLPHARRLSREILAALASGQLVSFQGSLASLVAERCASCLTGGIYKILKIPFGCIDSSIEVIIERIIKEFEEKNSPTAVILEGINRSAFDVYGFNIVQFIIDRVIQTRPISKSLLIFSTVLEGPSMLPVGSNLLEIGPLLNIDSIKWLDKPSATGPIGLIDKELFSYVPTTVIDYNWGESIIPNWLHTLGGPLWRRSVITADSYGRELVSSLETPFEFSIFGWIIPMIVHLDSNKLVDFIRYLEHDDRLRYILIKNSQEVVDRFELEVY
ncbi:hypothetical protein [Bacillus sp. T33-2]|uniref:hypothetical protein n=1 Tax=Bacillus sp. T33-2 TaxID=2054168 RepID=UPI000C790591|nr:hypothetical protein [Bacillus sp. T33-2]PLR92036.1 hypothetical protein CVD19_21045 [Bacillus sp. T33-2]